LTPGHSFEPPHLAETVHMTQIKRAKAMSERELPFIMPPQPPELIDPKKPVRGLGEWLNFLGFMVLAYKGARGGLAVLVMNEVYAATSDPAHRYSGAAVRKKSEEVVMPKVRDLAEGIARCLAIIQPSVEGIHQWLGALESPAAWETELALMLRKLRGIIPLDVFLLESDLAFEPPEDFAAAKKSIDAQFDAIMNELVPKVADLASVALPESTDRDVTSADDVPDAKGFVRNPADKRAYMTTQELISKHGTLLKQRNKRRALWAILDAEPKIRRWKVAQADEECARLGIRTRAICVHRGDWQLYLGQRAATKQTALKVTCPHSSPRFKRESLRLACAAKGEA
jgi:hypothetical protein